jgi:hypothetical protein
MKKDKTAPSAPKPDPSGDIIGSISLDPENPPEEFSVINYTPKVEDVHFDTVLGFLLEGIPVYLDPEAAEEVKNRIKELDPKDEWMMYELPELGNKTELHLDHWYHVGVTPNSSDTPEALDRAQSSLIETILIEREHPLLTERLRYCHLKLSWLLKKARQAQRDGHKLAYATCLREMKRVKLELKQIQREEEQLTSRWDELEKKENKE